MEKSETVIFNFHTILARLFSSRVRRFVTTCCVGTLMFQWKSIESMKRGDLLATTSDSALNPIIYLALSLSLFLLLPSLPSPPSFSVRRCARVMFSTKRREKDVCNVARACMRKKQTVCTPPRVHERESARGKERTIPHAACNEVYLGVRVIKPLSWFSCRASVTLFTGGKKKKKRKKESP